MYVLWFFFVVLVVCVFYVRSHVTRLCCMRCVCVCVRARACACVRACVRAFVRACGVSMCLCVVWGVCLCRERERAGVCD